MNCVIVALGACGLMIVSAAWSGPLAAHEFVEIHGTTLRLSDIEDLSSLEPALRSKAAAVIVAELKHTNTTTSLDLASLESRARAQLPVLGAQLVARTGQVVQVHAVAAKATSEEASVHSCWRLKHALAAGDALRLTDVETAACSRDADAGSIYYDAKQHVARARDDLATGTELMPISAQLLASVSRGQALQVQVHVGHVTLTREVTALQDAPGGHAVFVQTSEGDRLTAQLPQGAL